MAKVREFETGATRDTDDGKLDYEGFLSPLVLRAFAEYMHENRVQSDGSLRDSDNWQKGIPLDAYMKSGFRHFMEWWSAHRGVPIPHPSSVPVDIKKAVLALIFNAQGYLHELLKGEAGEEPEEDKEPFDTLSQRLLKAIQYDGDRGMVRYAAPEVELAVRAAIPAVVDRDLGDETGWDVT